MISFASARAAGFDGATRLEHPRYGPLSFLHDLPSAGPIFGSLEGFHSWRLDGFPELRPPLGPGFMDGYRGLQA